MTLDEYIEGLRGGSIAVIGAGVSNMPLIELLLKKGFPVTVRDKRSGPAFADIGAELERTGNVTLRLGSGYLEGLDEDIIFRTPGLHPQTAELVSARERGSTVTSEMEVFFSLCPCRTIAITGSDGKTTTSTVIAELLKAAGARVHLGGNIGMPLLTEIPNMKPEDFCVVELSSFQLHSMYCSPDVAVVTNISPNHLDVHPDMEDYIGAKKMVFKNQRPDARLVLNADDGCTPGFAAEVVPRAVKYFSKNGRVSDGLYLENGKIFTSQEREEPLMSISDILIPGEHNVLNYMAAFAAVDGLVPREVFLKVASTFSGVPHRMELVRTFRCVAYYNDSIATSPTRTIAGLRSFRKKPILIAGGYDKNVSFDELGEEIVRKVKALVLTGDTAHKIITAVERAEAHGKVKVPVKLAADFEGAVMAAHGMARDGDIVLLSPACASFDSFSNFEHRGNTFREIVNSLE